MVILAAVGEENDPERLLRTAHELATAFDDELRVLHAISREDAEEHLESVRSVHEFRDVSISTEMERAAGIAQEFVDATFTDEEAERVETVGEIGDPADVVLKTADELDARYVVIGGRKRSPVGKAAFGSVTQSVVLNAKQPVVTVLLSG